MKMTDVIKKAKVKGVKIKPDMSKADLIKAIQRAEGNFDCFGTAANYCDQMDCAWREDCIKC